MFPLKRNLAAATDGRLAFLNSRLHLRGLFIDTVYRCRHATTAHRFDDLCRFTKRRTVLHKICTCTVAKHHIANGWRTIISAPLLEGTALHRGALGCEYCLPHNDGTIWLRSGHPQLLLRLGIGYEEQQQDSE